MNRSRLPRLVVLLSLGLAAATGLTACGGMHITNTSDHDVSFSRSVPGGEEGYTLKPGSTLNLPRGTSLRMPDYTITAD
ncbi:MAG: hypothetical protein ACOYN0_13795 [Phycisphaerales bacterium]